jgi:hypothetical protein
MVPVMLLQSPKVWHLISSSLFASLGLMVGCSSTAPTVPHRPSLPEVEEHVLKPLAKEKVDEHLRQVKAEIEYWAASGTGWTELLTILGGTAGAAGTLGLGTTMGAAIGGGIGKALAADAEQRKQRDLAWGETQRIPLEHKVTAVLAADVHLTEDRSAFAVCLDGKERRYAANPSFRRLENGPGPCSTTANTLPGTGRQ